jgi:hypothetical protein
MLALHGIYDRGSTTLQALAKLCSFIVIVVRLSPPALSRLVHTRIPESAIQRRSRHPLYLCYRGIGQFDSSFTHGTESSASKHWCLSVAQIFVALKTIGTPAFHDGLEALEYLSDWKSPIVLARVFFELFAACVADLLIVREFTPCLRKKEVADLFSHGNLDVSGVGSLEQILQIGRSSAFSITSRSR